VQSLLLIPQCNIRRTKTTIQQEELKLEFFHVDAYEPQNTKVEGPEPSAVGIFILPPSGIAKPGNLPHFFSNRNYIDVVDERPFDYSLFGSLPCSNGL
jgi:hypothetical protein